MPSITSAVPLVSGGVGRRVRVSMWVSVPIGTVVAFVRPWARFLMRARSRFVVFVGEGVVTRGRRSHRRCRVPLFLSTTSLMNRCVERRTSVSAGVSTRLGRRHVRLVPRVFRYVLLSRGYGPTRGTYWYLSSRCCGCAQSWMRVCIYRCRPRGVRRVFQLPSWGFSSGDARGPSVGEAIRPKGSLLGGRLRVC